MKGKKTNCSTSEIVICSSYILNKISVQGFVYTSRGLVFEELEFASTGASEILASDFSFE